MTQLTKARAQRRLTASIVPGFRCYASALRQLISGSDDNGDGGAEKSDAGYTRSIACPSDSTNMAGHKSSTAAGSTRMDNNCSASDRHNGTPEIQS